MIHYSGSSIGYLIALVLIAFLYYKVARKAFSFIASLFRRK